MTAHITMSILRRSAFEIAARAAFREGMPKAGPVLLEPIMKVEVVTPEDFIGDVIGDLTASRGQITSMVIAVSRARFRAMVPLGKMFKYVSKLRGMTKGRGSTRWNSIIMNRSRPRLRRK